MFHGILRYLYLLCFTHPLNRRVLLQMSQDYYYLILSIRSFVVSFRRDVREMNKLFIIQLIDTSSSLRIMGILIIFRCAFVEHRDMW